MPPQKNFTTWVFVAVFREALFPMLTKDATGAFTKIGPSCSSPPLKNCLPDKAGGTISDARFTRSIPPLLICASRFFHGLHFAKQKRPSKFTRSSMSSQKSPFSFVLQREVYTTLDRKST